MKHSTRLRLLSLLVLIPIVLALVFPTGALAQDPTDPPPTEETQPPEPPPPVETELPPTVEAPTDAVPTEAVATDPVTAEAVVTDASTEAPSPEAPSDPEAVVSDAVQTASDIGLTLTDGGGEPLQMGTIEAAQTLLTGDPWFEVGSDIYRFLPSDGNCGDYSGDHYCTTASNPIQAALDYISLAANHDLFYDSHDHLTLTSSTVHVEAGTYHNPVVVSIPNITLYGDPGNTALAGAGADAPVLHGTGTGDGSVGVTITAEGVSLIGFVIENWETGILQDVLVGTTTTHIENNTIRDNKDGIKFVSEPHGKPGSEVHYNIFHGNTGYALINAGATGVDDNNIQDINATNNYWGCEEGPIVKFKNPDNGGDWDYIIWHEVFHHSNSSNPPIYDDNPDTDCGLLYGRDSLYLHGGNNYKPYKIIIDALGTEEVPPYCGDGVKDPGEACDPNAVPTGAPAHYTCLADCTTQYVPWCGDGIINGIEACDPQANPTGAPTGYVCLNDCTTQYVPTCGNGVKDPGEVCDPTANPTGAPEHYTCLANCTTQYVPWCGDGVVNGTEACDPTANPTGAPAHYTCLANCTTQYVPWCGDGVVNGTEVCDPTANPTGAPTGYVCLNNCTTEYAPSCGNGVKDPGEVCDPTADPTGAPEHYTCLSNCTTQYVPWCGDGVKDPGEACDPNANPTGAPDHFICLANCTTSFVPYCGDGVKSASEACDPTANPTGAPEHYVCTSECTTQYVPYCGDGIVNQRTEECDGSAPAGQICSEDCKLTTPPTPIPPAGGLLPGLTEDIAAGYAHTCAITPLGGVQCWGNNDYGQLGDGTFTGSNVPVDVVGLDSGRQIVAGSNHTCLLDGTDVWCWGQNDQGQLGDGTTTNRSTPVMVLSGASYITAGADYTCASLLSGVMMCWGNNSAGQLGDGTTVDHTTPTLASQIEGVWGADGGQDQTCALTPTGQISCWTGGLIPVTGGVAQSHKQVSASRFGSQIIGVDLQGIPITIDENGAIAVSGLSGVIDVDSGVDHACARLASGIVKCWGGNDYGQLGDRSTIDSDAPVSVTNLSAPLDMAVGRNHACVILIATMQNTLIRCWGLNSDGQLGNGSLLNSPVPVDVQIIR